MDVFKNGVVLKRVERYEDGMQKLTLGLAGEPLVEDVDPGDGCEVMLVDLADESAARALKRWQSGGPLVDPEVDLGLRAAESARLTDDQCEFLLDTLYVWQRAHQHFNAAQSEDEFWSDYTCNVLDHRTVEVPKGLFADVQ